MRRMPRIRATTIVAAVLVGGLLSGCSADWSGAARLAADECQTAARLFVPTTDPRADAALSESLRAHVPVELTEILTAFAEPPAVADTASADEVAAGTVQRERHSQARALLQEWAVLACGPDVAGGDSSTAAPEDRLPSLESMQLHRSDLDGTTQLAVAGALDPVHALALCEEARTDAGAVAIISVRDADGLLLVSADAGGECHLDPLLMEAITEH